MTKIYVEKINETFIRIHTEAGIEQELSDNFTFFANNYKWHPKFKARIWDGKIRLYSTLKKTLYTGLLEDVKRFADKNGYEVQTNGFDTPDLFDRDLIYQWIEKLNIHSDKNKLGVREYQIQSFLEAIQEKKRVLISPTASGKSLIIYLCIRYLLAKKKKIILVVPTTALVDQMYKDFQDYSSEIPWDIADYAQTLYSGQSKDITKQLLITTWQSIYKNDKKFFEGFDAVIGDEAHGFKATSLISIMEKCVNAEYRIATTGTLNKSTVSDLTIKGLFGPITIVTTTKALMDAGYISELKIKVCVLNYPDPTRKVISKLEYDKEMEFLCYSEKRRKFIANLAMNTKGNTIILVSRVEKMGKPLYELLKQISEETGKKKVFAVYGDVNVDEIAEIKEIVKKNKDCVIVASYQKFSTGANVPSIENVIFGSPSKSSVRVLQSIGRGLRLSEGKTSCTLYDIADNLSWKGNKCSGMLHLADRIKIYTEEEFEYSFSETMIDERI